MYEDTAMIRLFAILASVMLLVNCTREHDSSPAEGERERNVSNVRATIPPNPQGKYVLNYEPRSHEPTYGQPSKYLYSMNGISVGSYDELKKCLTELSKGSTVEYFGSCFGDPFTFTKDLEVFRQYCKEIGIRLVFHPSG